MISCEIVICLPSRIKRNIFIKKIKSSPYTLRGLSFLSKGKYTQSSRYDCNLDPYAVGPGG